MSIQGMQQTNVRLEYVGEASSYLTRKKVMLVTVPGGTEIRQGDELQYGPGDDSPRHVADSIQINRKGIPCATGPAKIGIQIIDWAGNRHFFEEDIPVFRVTRTDG